ncbi:DUF5691 domain-containing protein [Shewanella algae]|uniref:DUF5691 domain-containing protein n=1 Tax=Shewanella algae TaxID=38313 RepID=UPI0031F50B4F
MLNAETLQQDLAQIDELKQRWLIGDGGAPILLPEHWTVPADADDDERTLMALAYCSQYPLLQQPHPPGALKTLLGLPQLSLSLLPGQCRPAFRQLLALTTTSGSQYQALLALLVSRGFSPHPEDWLPARQDAELPPEFEPWVCWVTDARDEPLTEESWPDKSPAQRLAALKLLRRRSPDAARDLLVSMAASEAADKRLNLYQVLADGLSLADLPLLVSLEKDRSQKVKELANQLQMRLGQGNQQAEDETLTELVTWLSLKPRGLLRRETVLLAPVLKNSVQNRDRCAALKSISLPLLATGLGMSLEQLLCQWSFADNAGKGLNSPNQALLLNVAASLPEEQVLLVANRLLDWAVEENENPMAELGLLVSRLNEQAKVNLAQALLSKAPGDLLPNAPYALFSGEWHWLSVAEFSRCKAMAELLKQLKTLVQAKDADEMERQLAWVMQQLGLCLNLECAQWLLAETKTLGISPMHPILDYLKFNVSLQREG